MTELENELAWLDIEINKIHNQVIDNRRYLHMHPEVGFDTENTEEMVKKQLNDLGVEMLHSSVGVLGRIKGRNSEKIIALRADMDALPLQEENDVEYKSLYLNQMHACGHDGHTSILLGAAQILQKYKSKLPYDILLVFQPAEEGPNLGGARIIMKDLTDEGYAKKIIAMYGLHLFNDFDIGTIGYKFGNLMASTDEFDIKIIGKSGHAGHPNKAIDALSIGCKYVKDMESYMSRSLDPLDSAVFSVGMFQSGSAKNIIPESAVISGTIRCQREKTREDILTGMDILLRKDCEAFGATYKLDILHGLPVLINNDNITEHASNIFKKVFGKDKVFKIPSPSMGAEDFAYYAEKLPSTFIFIGSRNEEKGFVNLAHNSKFDFDENAMFVGIKAFCSLALNK